MNGLSLYLSFLLCEDILTVLLKKKKASLFSFVIIPYVVAKRPIHKRHAHANRDRWPLVVIGRATCLGDIPRSRVQTSMHPFAHPLSCKLAREKQSEQAFLPP
jgi:hypothetical protein